MRDIEILNANLLDIIFENRNKNYGAYTLRKFYPGRLTKSLSVALGLVLFLYLITLSDKKHQVVDVPGPRPDVILTEVIIPPPKPPDPPKPIEQPRTTSVAYTSRIIFTERTTLPTDRDIDLKLISTKTINAPILSTILPQIESPQPVETTTPTNNTPAGTTCDAAYPGGREKFAEFLKTKLNTPEDLVAGQKQKVLVRFKVDVDGSISQIEVIESGGVKFDNEVIRVMKKMPKWSPAMQNGTKVSSYFIQVVTFIGEEQ